MKDIFITFEILLILVFLGCKNFEVKNNDSSLLQNGKAQIDTVNLGIDSNSSSSLKDTVTNVKLSDPKSRKDIARYLFTEYRTSKADTTTQRLKIAQNIITFFITNSEIKELEKFRKKGFPLEFWGAGGCSFFGIQFEDLQSKVKIAEDLGYRQYGFLCEDHTHSNLTVRKILTNQMRIKFMTGATIEVINKILNSVDFYEIDKISFLPNSYLARVKNKTAKSLVKQFKKLSLNQNIESIEYIFSDCDYTEPDLLR